ncbi:MAG: hypothetical protein OHK0057_12900 [Thermoflexibacter sp.]
MEKEYTNGEVTIVWKPDICIHSTKCFKGLHSVFNPTKRPWINMAGADTEKIIEQVNKCPSKALSFYQNGAEESEKAPLDDVDTLRETKIEVIPNGPLKVEGNVLIKEKNGMEVKKGKAFFCRCGASSNKPYCDGTHKKINFQDF